MSLEHLAAVVVLIRLGHSVGHYPSNVLLHHEAVILLDRLLCRVGHYPSDVLGHPSDVVLFSGHSKRVLKKQNNLRVFLGKFQVLTCLRGFN